MKIRICMTMSILEGLALLCSLPASAASFDCAAVRSPVEQLVCATPELSDMDEDLGYLYRHLAIPSGETRERTAQRQWIKRRDACAADVACVRTAYIDRIAGMLGSPLLRLESDAQSYDETKVRLKKGWVIDDEGEPRVQAPCIELEKFANREAAYWWRFQTSNLHYSYCTPVTANAPFFDMPPWQSLDSARHKPLLARLLRFKEEGIQRYFQGPHAHDDDYFDAQANRFIAEGGTLKLWSTHLFDTVSSADMRETIVTANKIQHVVQLGTPIPPYSCRRTRSPECNYPTEKTQLFLASDDLSGPAEMHAGELESAVLRLYRNNPVLIQV